MIEKKNVRYKGSQERRFRGKKKTEGQEGFEENGYTIVDEEPRIIEKSSIVLNLYVKEDQEFGAEIDQSGTCKIEKRGPTTQYI